MTPEEDGGAKVFRSRYPRWIASRAMVGITLASVGGVVIFGLHVTRSVVDQQASITSILGRAFADTALVRCGVAIALSCVFAVALPWFVAWKVRHSWERLTLTAEGIEVSRGAQSLRAAWCDVSAIERLRGTAYCWLRTPGFGVSLEEFYSWPAPAGSRWRLRRLADTEVVRELTERRGLAIVNLWPPWHVSAALLLVLCLYLAHAWPQFPLPDSVRTMPVFTGAPVEDLGAFDDYVARWPSNNWARGERARALASLGRIDEARAEAERAAEGDPNMEQVWSLRRDVADLSGDAGWAVTAWLQPPTLLPTGDNSESFFAPLTPDFPRKVTVGRRLFLAGEVGRARRWFDAAARDAARTPDPPERAGLSARFAVRMIALGALCDVAEGQPERALAALESQPASHLECLVVTALAQRCLGLGADATATIARIEQAEPASECSAAGQIALMAWLRGEAVEMPRTFTLPSAPGGRGSYEAPLFVVAAGACEARPE